VIEFERLHEPLNHVDACSMHQGCNQHLEPVLYQCSCVSTAFAGHGSATGERAAGSHLRRRSTSSSGGIRDGTASGMDACGWALSPLQPCTWQLQGHMPRADKRPVHVTPICCLAFMTCRQLNLSAAQPGCLGNSTAHKDPTGYIMMPKTRSCGPADASGGAYWLCLHPATVSPPTPARLGTT
jgi:hypothetical protein